MTTIEAVDGDVAEAERGNLCRCGIYGRVRASGHRVPRRMTVNEKPEMDRHTILRGAVVTAGLVIGLHPDRNAPSPTVSTARHDPWPITTFTVHHGLIATITSFINARHFTPFRFPPHYRDRHRPRPHRCDECRPVRDTVGSETLAGAMKFLDPPAALSMSMPSKRFRMDVRQFSIAPGARRCHLPAGSRGSAVCRATWFCPREVTAFVGRS